MPEAEHGPEGGGGVLKSQNSRVKSYVVFRNCTRRPVDVIWIGFQGEPVWYATLEPSGHKMINTFATHPWIFRDPDTGERMVVQGKDVYMPQPYHRGQLSRYQVTIEFPMRPLLQNALWTIARLLRDDSQVHQLELPRSLAQDLLAIRQITAQAIEFKRTHQAADDEG